MRRLRGIRGIKGWMLRKFKREAVPDEGTCIMCGKAGQVHYFVAAKLPRILHLCDSDYMLLRVKLEAYLKQLLEGSA